MAKTWHSRYARLRRQAAKLPFSLRIGGLYSLVIGVFLFANAMQPPAAPTISTAEVLSEIVASQPAPSTIAKPDRVTGTANQLIIPRLGIDLPIIPGGYNAATDTWDLSTHSVHFATMTTPVNNESGHTLLYGHNNRKMLGPTRNIVVGDELLVKTVEGQTFRYLYQGDTVVDPSETSVVGESSKRPTLTLLTCEGLWYEQRRLLRFTFSGVSL